LRRSVANRLIFHEALLVDFVKPYKTKQSGSIKSSGKGIQVGDLFPSSQARLNVGIRELQILFAAQV